MRAYVLHNFFDFSLCVLQVYSGAEHGYNLHTLSRLFFFFPLCLTGILWCETRIQSAHTLSTFRADGDTTRRYYIYIYIYIYILLTLLNLLTNLTLLINVLN